MPGDDLTDDELLKADFFSLTPAQQKRRHGLNAKHNPFPGALKNLTLSERERISETIMDQFPEIEREFRTAEVNWSHDKDNQRREASYIEIRKVFNQACESLGFSPSEYNVLSACLPIIRKVRRDLEAEGLQIYPIDAPYDETI